MCFHCRGQAWAKVCARFLNVSVLLPSTQLAHLPTFFTSSALSGLRSKLLSGASDGQQRDFARFWEQYVPGGARTSEVSRPLMREVLLRAIREKSLLPTHRQWAEELVANAMSSAPSTLAVEKAFGIYQALMLGWYRWY
eukprot:g5106.t1